MIYFTAEKTYDYKKATWSKGQVIKILFGEILNIPKPPKSSVVIINADLTNTYEEIANPFRENKKICFTKKSDNYYLLDHHYAHVLSSKIVSPDADNGIAVDAGGNVGNVSVFYNLNDINKTRVVRDESIGGTYFQILEKGLKKQIGKIMGLQSYGKLDSEFYKKIDKISFEKLASFYKKTFEEMVKSGFPKDYNYDKVYTAHQYGVDMIVNLFKKYFSKGEKVAFGGGCALSIPTNEALLKEGFDISVCPAANDSGISLGCIKFADMLFNLNIDWSNIQYKYVSPKQNEYVYEEVNDKTIYNVAKLLADGNIVGWCHGLGEVGPRALGHRSFLMNPSIENGKDFINEQIKHREWWRPFGGSIIDTSVLEDYTPSNLDPFMLRTFKFKKEWEDKFKSIIHTDGTSRLQIVTDKNDPFYKIIKEFYNLTGIPGLLNTSYNLGGKPIAESYKTICDTYNYIDNLKHLYISNIHKSK